MAEDINFSIQRAELPSASRTTEEYLRSLSKGLVGVVPFAGGLVAEIIDVSWVPARAKKMQEWYVYVDQLLHQILEKGILTKEQLMQDEQFASLFQKTTKAYLDNVEAFKRPALQSALKSSLTQAIPLDKKYIFLQILEDLNETQLMILKEIYENAHDEQHKYGDQLDAELSVKYAGGDPVYLKLLKKGLDDYNLLYYRSADVIQNGVNQWSIIPNEIVDEFLQYITTA